MSCHKEIENRIFNLPKGSVITINDFTDVSEPKTVSKILGRLCEKGQIEKIFRGVFWKPSQSEPSIDDLAKGIARSNNWTVLPCGESALNIFGLGDKKKLKLWTYITDGTNRQYSYKNVIICFKHGASKVINTLSKETLIIGQIIKTCKPGLSEEQIKKIRNIFNAEQKAIILEEAKHLASWINASVKRIFKTDSVSEKR